MLFEIMIMILQVRDKYC